MEDCLGLISAALQGSYLVDYEVSRRVGGKDLSVAGGTQDSPMLHGACSFVYEAQCKRPAATGVKLALKVMINTFGDQTSDLAEQFSAEYELLADTSRLPRHKNIISVLHRFVDEASGVTLPGFNFDPQNVSPRTVFVVMPLLHRDLKGEMKRTFRAGAFFPEARVRRLLRQLMEAIAHLKSHRIVHRDLKADNLMLDGDGEDEQLQLIDFGQCLDCQKYELDGFKMPLPTPVSRGGAPGFLAPEVVKPQPGPQTVLDYAKNDEWAVGMLLHALLSGLQSAPGPVAAPSGNATSTEPASNGSPVRARAVTPFCSGDDPRYFRDEDYQPVDTARGNYTEEMASLTRSLLRVDPEQRPNAAELIQQLRPMPIIAHIRLVSGKVVPIEVDADAEVSVLKDEIAKRSNGCLTAAHVRLIFGGRELQGDVSMSQYNLQYESTVQIQMRLPEASVRLQKIVNHSFW